METIIFLVSVFVLIKSMHGSIPLLFYSRNVQSLHCRNLRRKQSLFISLWLLTTRHKLSTTKVKLHMHFTTTENYQTAVLMLTRWGRGKFTLSVFLSIFSCASY